jgi:hypothetical protein
MSSRDDSAVVDRRIVVVVLDGTARSRGCWRCAKPCEVVRTDINALVVARPAMNSNNLHHADTLLPCFQAFEAVLQRQEPRRLGSIQKNGGPSEDNAGFQPSNPHSKRITQDREISESHFVCETDYEENCGYCYCAEGKSAN